MMSLPDIIEDREEKRHDFMNNYAKSHLDFGQNMNLTFKNGFSFTGALLSAKKR